MKEKSVCFTGHRTLPADHTDLKKRLVVTVAKLALAGYTDFYVGGALGFDTLCAKALLYLKEKHLAIRLHIAVPCRTQADGWDAADRTVYADILSRADEVHILSEQYFRGCMQARNRFMVDNSAVCVSYLTKPTGGTAYTVHYAETHGVQVIKICPQSGK